ncbi:transporter substrate-binding domain-containing protein [Microbacterium sp. MYb45]|uniref:transporter substrate-binding domain-containing protein n=1 Tax=Microbacterium sp. MYb45 TaxID=1827294 RepID=UPI00280A6A69|nr:transporter substrate-binding domain-containing protein [Microbacterium sp. MYb45]
MDRSAMTQRRRIRRPVASLVVLAAVALLAGCGLSIPTDPDGTLDSVSGGVLRVGTSPDGELVEVSQGDPTGTIVDLVDRFADSIDADTEWTVASEETLVTELEAGDLDLIAGGITPDTPWIDRAGVTRGYRGIEGADGRELVMLVPLGENAFLSTLETFLDEEVGG